MEGIKKSEWYQEVSLEDAKLYIRSNLLSEARSFIASGYYLKHIRDNGLYLEDGYKNISEFAYGEYGLSTSATSRRMSINDRFSQGGNSPNIKDEFRDFRKSQLQEMLGLSEEQLGKVTPDTQVMQIREMKRSENIAPYTGPQVAGQIEITEFPEYMPGETLLDDLEHIDIQHEKTGTVSMEISVEDMIGDASGELDTGAVAISQKEPLSAYGTSKKVYPEGSMLSTPGCDGGHDCFNCHAECGIRQRYCYCVEAPMGNPFPCATLGLMENLKREIGGRCQFVDNSLANHRTVDKEPVPCCKNCTEPCRYACERARKVEEAAEPVKTFSTELTGCIHREGYGCTLTNENKAIPGDGNVCNCCWDCKYHGMCHFECNASAGRSGEMPVFDAAWFVKKWREIRPNDFQRAANACDIDGAMSAKAKAIQEAISPYGAYCIGSSDWKFDFHGFAGGMDFKVGKESVHLKYGRLATEILELLHEEPSIEGLGDTVILEEEEPHEPEPVEDAEEEALYYFTAGRCGANDGAYGATWAAIVKAYLDKLHDNGTAPISGDMPAITVQAMGHDCLVEPGYDAEFWKDDRLWFKVEWQRLQNEYEWFYPEKPEGEPQAPVAQKTVADGDDCDSCQYNERGFCQYPETSEDYCILGSKKDVAIPGKPVIDTDYTEVKEEQEEYTLEYFLKEQNQKLEEFLKVEGVPYIVLERQKMIVCALAAMKADLEIEEFKRTYKPEQPELPTLKNNDQRGAFVDAYETWPLWIETKETGERYYKYNLPDGTSMVVKVYYTKLFDGYKEGSYESMYREGYGRQEYYLVREGKFFKECEENRSYLIDKLKEIQRKDK